MKHKLKRMVLALSGTVCLLCSGIPLQVSAHYDTAYWHETQSSGSHADWMKDLKGSLKLSDLSIPGTHDSMAFRADLTAIDNTRTQTMTLQQQLDSGIRYIDIRAKYTSGGFPLHHGPVYLGYDFEDVLKTVNSFLQQHPGETVLMRFKQEQSSASDAQMLQVFLTYYNRYKELFWKPGGSAIPALDECRGKLVLLSDVYSLNDFGLNYRKVEKQDYYNLGTNWDLYSKWEQIKAFAQSHNRASGVLTLNHLSAGSAGVMPYFAASGHSSPQTGAPRLLTGLTEPAFQAYYPEFPREGQLGDLASIAFEGMNTMFADYASSASVSYTGIVAADFPGERLIHSIIKKNNAYVTEIYEGQYMLALSNYAAYVLDSNSNTPYGVTLWQKNAGANQKWNLMYDPDKKAYQIINVHTNTVLTWNSSGGNDVVLRQNGRSQEQYWVLDKQIIGTVLRNYKDQSKMLRYEGTSPTSGSVLKVGPMELQRSFFTMVK